jgi:hypothetical protein
MRNVNEVLGELHSAGRHLKEADILLTDDPARASIQTLIREIDEAAEGIQLAAQYDELEARSPRVD